MPEITANQWEAFLAYHPDAHLLQTAAWGQLKAEFGWTPVWIATGSGKDTHDTGAQLLFRPLPLGYSLAYIPKGPVGGGVRPETNMSSTDCVAGWQSFWPEVQAACRQRKAVFLKVEPDLWEPVPTPAQVPVAPGFRKSPHTVQPPRTLLVDLSGEEEAVLGRMKQKTRYNIKLAQKKGVVVRSLADMQTFYELMKITGRRDNFGVHAIDYYQRAYDLFHPYGTCEMLLAEYEGEPLAALMVFARGRRAWYLYGASNSEERERMPTYLLQWEAMRWAKSHGCQEYDLWGVPDFPEEKLEAYFTQHGKGLWGVYRFKRGFGGKLQRAAGPWDQVYNGLMYRIYRVWANRG